MKPVKVLCVGGSDSGGGAGLQADLKAVYACDCYGMSVITALTAQNTRGVQGIYPVSAEFVGKQLSAVLSDIGADALKTGMLLTAGIVQVVVKKIKEYNIDNVIVDPVMLAKGGRTLLQERARAELVKKLLPLALVVTPNIPEAEYLAQMKIKSTDAMKKAAVLIYRLGVKNVLIKGGHLPGSKRSGAIDILYDGKKYYELSACWVDTKDTHGTGCTFASVLAAEIARGENMVAAAQKAKKMVTDAIKNSLKIGSGHGPVNVLFKCWTN
jgi:hydroxymethylpyrimidine/phosphomethylpyrimidine kinase